MHSALARANAVLAFATSAALFLVAVIAASSLFPALVPTTFSNSHDHMKMPTLALTSVAVRTPTNGLHSHFQSFYHRPRHYAVTRFNLTADFAPLFGWNVKQVHAMLTLDYTLPQSASSGHGNNRLTVWDAVLASPDDARLVLVDTVNRFAITDPRYTRADRLDAANATMRLEWCVHAHYGTIRCERAPDSSAAVVSFTMPSIGGRPLLADPATGKLASSTSSR
ncbi:signal peptidase 22kDa subunit [Blastocladiella britannica]|nr:signal peptidase 22kDa subunit [Blastocladiella britannica]